MWKEEEEEEEEKEEEEKEEHYEDIYSLYFPPLPPPPHPPFQEGLVVPSDKAISEIGAVFNRMIKTYCAISKLEYLLEAVRLTYENVS